MSYQQDISGYEYPDYARSHAHGYLLPEVEGILREHYPPEDKKRVFDLGCGNGSVAAFLTARGYDVTGVDPSIEGIKKARDVYPDLNLHEGSAYENLAGKFGRFPVVLSLEVVEHVYDPRAFARCIYDLLERGGMVIISTPYHGYWKNLVLSITGKMDEHFTALWDHGHIKFWSIDTLKTLLIEAGFKEITFRRVGRIPPLAKSMIATGKKSTQNGPRRAN